MITLNNNTTKIAVCLGMIFLTASKANAKNLEYAYVNIAKVMDAIPAVETARGKFKAEVEAKRKIISNKFEDYKKTMSMLQNSQETLTAKVRKNLENKARQLETELQSAQMEFETFMQNRQQELFEPIEKDIEKTAEAFCKEKQIDQLEAINNAQGKRYLYINKKYDRTAEFVAKIKKNTKK